MFPLVILKSKVKLTLQGCRCTPQEKIILTLSVKLSTGEDRVVKNIFRLSGTVRAQSG